MTGLVARDALCACLSILHWVPEGLARCPGPEVVVKVSRALLGVHFSMSARGALFESARGALLNVS